jgi:hypothetical protein
MLNLTPPEWSSTSDGSEPSAKGTGPWKDDILHAGAPPEVVASEPRLLLVRGDAPGNMFEALTLAFVRPGGHSGVASSRMRVADGDADRENILYRTAQHLLGVRLAGD